MVKKHTPVRMCISCKERLEQNRLIRLQCKNKKIITYSNEGRSFYICKNCLSSNKNDKIIKSLLRYCKTDKKSISNMFETYKEKIFNG